MEAFFQLKGWVSTGGWPRGAQVRRTLGVRLSALSSRRPDRLCACGRLLDPRPGLLVRGMVAHAGQPLDHQRDAVQGPQLPGEPVGGGAFQDLFDLAELAVRQPWGGAGRPMAAQVVGATSRPAGMPVADALAGDSQLRATSAWPRPAANSSAARSRRAWRRSRSCCAAARREVVGMR
jgi:hypothetical protein